MLDGLRSDGEMRYWIECLEAQEGNCDIEADTGQMTTEPSGYNVTRITSVAASSLQPAHCCGLTPLDLPGELVIRCAHLVEYRL